MACRSPRRSASSTALGQEPPWPPRALPGPRAAPAGSTAGRAPRRPPPRSRSGGSRRSRRRGSRTRTCRPRRTAFAQRHVVRLEPVKCWSTLPNWSGSTTLRSIFMPEWVLTRAPASPAFWTASTIGSSLSVPASAAGSEAVAITSMSFTESARRRSEPATSTRSRGVRSRAPTTWSATGSAREQDPRRRPARRGRRGPAEVLLHLAPNPRSPRIPGRGPQGIERVDPQLVVEPLLPALRRSPAGMTDTRPTGIFARSFWAAGMSPVSSSAVLLERLADPRQLRHAALARELGDGDRRVAHRAGGVAVGDEAVLDDAVELVEVGQSSKAAAIWAFVRSATDPVHGLPVSAPSGSSFPPTTRRPPSSPSSGACSPPCPAPTCWWSTTPPPTAPVRSPSGWRPSTPRRGCHRAQRPWPAYLAGFAHALRAGAARVIQMTSTSHTTPPTSRACCCDAALVIGSRYVPRGGVEGWGALRRTVSRAGCTYARRVLDAPVRDLTSGIRCWRADALAAIVPAHLRSQGYAFQVELAYRTLLKGLSVEEIPIVFRGRAQPLQDVGLDRARGRGSCRRRGSLENLPTNWRHECRTPRGRPGLGGHPRHAGALAPAAARGRPPVGPPIRRGGRHATDRHLGGRGAVDPRSVRSPCRASCGRRLQ